MAYVTASSPVYSLGADRKCFSEVNLHAMRMGPGKHLHGLTLMNGLVTPEEVSSVYLTSVRVLTGSLVRLFP